MYLTEIAQPEDACDEDGEHDATLDREGVRRAINETWGKIYRELASDPTHDPLDEDEFVAAHLSLYRNPKESSYSPATAEMRLFKMFCKNPGNHPKSEETDESDEGAITVAQNNNLMEECLSLEKIISYVNDLRELAPVWSKIHQEFDSACGRCRLLGDKREVKIFLAAVWLRSVEEAQTRQEVFESAEKLLFRRTIGAGVDDSRFATWARRLHGKCIRQLKRNDQKELTLDGLRSELSKRLDDKKPTAESVIKYFREEEQSDFYGWSQTGLRYFLMKAEETIPGQSLTWEQFEDISIEHILPQSSTQTNSRGNRWWGRVLDDYADQILPNGSETEKRVAFERLVDSLGNLVLLTKEENSCVSSKAWETYPNRPGKRDFYLASENKSSCGARTLAQGDRAWNAWRIRERGRTLLRKLVSEFVTLKSELPNADLDSALGFPTDEMAPNLEDRPIRSLTADEVSNRINADEEEENVAKRAARIKSAKQAQGEQFTQFWCGFREWSRRAGRNVCNLTTHTLDRQYLGSAFGAPLCFELNGNARNPQYMVSVDIYCFKNGGTSEDMERMREEVFRCKDSFSNALEMCDVVDWNVNPGSVHNRARKIRFTISQDWHSPTDDLFQRLADCYETVRNAWTSISGRLQEW